MRYLAIDFETNGRPNDRVLPLGAFPTQVSVDAYDPDTGKMEHLYDSYIAGARSLSDWVLAHTLVTLDKLKGAPLPGAVSDALGAICQEDDVVVAHNACFDLDQVLPKFAAPDHALMRAPVVDTMREPWVKKAIGSNPSFQALCAHFNVPFCPRRAHDACYDSHALALCLQAAHEKGRTWTVKPAKERKAPRMFFCGGARSEHAPLDLLSAPLA
jgi:DNA polymerase III epsilon subunit-like protein